MAHRIIKSAARSSSLQLADCLSSLFALELAEPSRVLYLISPWISDVPLVANRFGRFRAVLPEEASGDVRLAALLNTLADRGADVRVLVRAHQPQAEECLRQLSSTVKRRLAESLHEKGLIGDQFYLRGSMNFTYSGVNLNDEHVELTTDPEVVALALTEAGRRWEDGAR